MDSTLLLLGAGAMAGGMNALAGGGSFVSLPALIAAGVPSVAANASSSVALYPGGLASAWVYRGSGGRVGGASTPAMLVVSVAGGLIGSLLLLWTPPSAFDVVLPWLLLLATLTLAFAQPLGVALRGAIGSSVRVVLPVQFLLAIYGGYFGGAVGLMMMAAWSLLDGAEPKILNGPRTLMVSAANTAAIVLLAAAGLVRWRETALVAVSALIGGYLGAHLGRRLKPSVVKAATLVLAATITLLFFLRAYGP